MLGWLLQFRVVGSGAGARIRCRFRVASHLVYWYGITAVQGVLWLVLGLVMADPLNQCVLQSEPLTVAENRIVIVIAHRLSIAALADHVVFLADGRVLEQGTHAGLMARQDGHYRRFVDLQTEAVA